ncbi:MAG: hypothetical protein AAFV29_24995, partial [Myxococcota bacterium]
MAWSKADNNSYIAFKVINDLNVELNYLLASDFSWPSRQLEACLEMLAEGTTDIANVLVSLHTVPTEWESQLDALESLLGLTSATSETKTGDERVAWIVTLHASRSTQSLSDILSETSNVPARPKTSISVEPRLQKRRKNGWTAGRPIAVSRLHAQPHTVPALTDDDRRIAATIRKYQNYYESYYAYSADLPLALVGHPRIFWSSKDETPVEVRREIPSIRVDKDKKGQLTLTITPTPPGTSTWYEQKEGRLIIYTLTEEQQRLTDRIGDGLQLPPQAELRLKGLLTRAAGLLPV